MLNLNQLHIFHVAAHSRTLREAADKLFISQPAVSQQIRNLESIIGTKLFERSRQGVKLTEAGYELLHYTRQILELTAQAEVALTNFNYRDDVRAVIGATPNIGAFLLPLWMQPFREQHPNITIVIETDTTPQIVTAVSEGRQLMGFVEGELEAEDASRVDHLILEEIPNRVVVGPGHPWWGRPHMSIHELSGQPLITRQANSQSYIWLNGIFQEHGVKPRITGEFDNPETLKQGVRFSKTATVLPLRAVERDVEMGLLWALEVEDVPLERAMRLVWQRGVIFPAITRVMLGFLSGHYPDVDKLLNSV
jgi:DNA-binding transcriptional LysR family regulator